MLSRPKAVSKHAGLRFAVSVQRDSKGTRGESRPSIRCFAATQDAFSRRGGESAGEGEGGRGEPDPLRLGAGQASIRALTAFVGYSGCFRVV